MSRLLRSLLIGAITLVICIAPLMFGSCQRQLIYFPARAAEADALRLAEQEGLEAWRVDGGIAGWKSPEPPDLRRRLVVFHGNAGFALHRTHFLHLPPDRGQWQVFLFEYPGYGARPGSPSEDDFQTAAASALTALRRDKPDIPIFVAGESIGSGVASWLAGRSPEEIAGLILITPMTSLVDVAALHYPWLPVRWMLHDRFDSLEALGKYHGPAAFVVASDDTIIPPALGRRLFESYGGPRRLWMQEGAGHNSVDYAPATWAPIFQFLREPR